MCLAARGIVFEYGFGGGQHGGKGGGRGQPYVAVLGVVDDVGVIGVQFGKDGFGRDKENCTVCRVRRADVFVGDVVNVFFHVFCQLDGILRGLCDFAVAFQRKFGINGEVAGGRRQMQQAVWSFAVGQGVLVGNVLGGNEVVDE